MISKQEIFGAGDLKANEELKNNFSKDTSTGQNILTEDWLKEKTREFVLDHQRSDTLFQIVDNLTFNDRIVCAWGYIEHSSIIAESPYLSVYMTFMLADNLVPQQNSSISYDCIFSEIHVVAAAYEITGDTIAEAPDYIDIDKGVCSTKTNNEAS